MKNNHYNKRRGGGGGGGRKICVSLEKITKLDVHPPLHGSTTGGPCSMDPPRRRANQAAVVVGEARQCIEGHHAAGSGPPSMDPPRGSPVLHGSTGGKALNLEEATEGAAVAAPTTVARRTYRWRKEKGEGRGGEEGRGRAAGAVGGRARARSWSRRTVAAGGRARTTENNEKKEGVRRERIRQGERQRVRAVRPNAC